MAFMSAMPWLLLAVIVVAALVIRWRRVSLLGPLFYWELVRLARHRRAILPRVGYAVFLLLAMFLVYGTESQDYESWLIPFPVSTVLPYNSLARFAESFVYAILTLQMAAILVLTPAYVAGAIAEEREGKRLELLLTTHLSDREIVLGKLFARLAHLGGILLTGLPILCLLQFFGGVDIERLLSQFAACLFAMLGVGSLSMLVSVYARSALSAVILAYFCTALPGMFLCVPVLDKLLGTMLTFGSTNVVLAVICLTIAIVDLRRKSRPAVRMERVAQPTGWGPFEALSTQQAAVSGNGGEKIDVALPPWRPRRATDRPQLLPSIKDNALLWKETNHPGRASRDLGDGLLTLGALLLVFFFLPIYVVTLAVGGSRAELWISLRVLLLLGSCVVGMGIAFRASGSVVQERHTKTLDSLLALPVTRTEILRSKWLGSILRWRFGIGLTMLIIVFGVLTTAFHPLAALLYIAVFSVQVAFLASVGVWVSTLARTPVQANFTIALLVLVYVAGSLSGLSAKWSPQMAWLGHALEVGLNPIGACWFLAFSWGDWKAADAVFWRKLVWALAGMAVYCSLAVVCWLAAVRRFRST